MSPRCAVQLLFRMKAALSHGTPPNSLRPANRTADYLGKRLSSLPQVACGLKAHYCTVTLRLVDCDSPDAPLATTWTVYVPAGVVVEPPPPPPDEPLPPPAQPVSEFAAAPSRSSNTIVRKAILSFRRRLASASASKLGRPSIAAHVVAREFPKGEEGNERLAVVPV